MFLRISRFITAVALPLLTFPLIYLIQLRLGYEFALFPLYMFPIAKLTWEFGWKGALFAVFFSTFLWVMASKLSGQSYTYEWLRYYNAGIRSVVFMAVGVFIMIFKRVVEQHRQRMEAMRSLLNVCHGCGALQGSDGQWVPLDKLVSKATKHSCECPICTKSQLTKN